MKYMINSTSFLLNRNHNHQGVSGIFSEQPKFFLISAFLLFIFSQKFYSQSFSAGGRHSIIVCQNNSINEFGRNDVGQFANGSTLLTNISPSSPGLSNIKQVAAGDLHTVFLKSDSTVWASGYNVVGQLGDGTTVDKLSAVQVIGLPKIKKIAVGSNHSVFLAYDSTVWTVGYNFYGQLGKCATGNDSIPVHLAITGVKDIAAGYYTTNLLKYDGTVWACGRNDRGEAGNNVDYLDHTCLGQVYQAGGLTNIIKIFCSAGRSSYFIKSDSTVWACGLNNYGQLGIDDVATPYTRTPFQIPGLPKIKEMDGTYYSATFLAYDSTMWVCGLNDQGQLGDGTNVKKNSVIQLASITGVIAISGGKDHVLFLKKDSTLWAHGDNLYGQLGDGTGVDQWTPVQVNGLCPVDIPLPIELLSFNAVSMGNKVSLTWSTASETNNNFFTIEKSVDGTDWKSIGIVMGAGNSTHVLNYESFDTEPVNGIQYYKLKQTDYDGQYKYSTPIAVDFSDDFSFSIYPNPVYANSGAAVQLNFNQLGEDSKPILVVVYDAIGKETLSKVNIIDKNNGQVTAVDPSNTLSPGVYIISATSDNSIYKQKLIVR